MLEYQVVRKGKYLPHLLAFFGFLMTAIIQYRPITALNQGLITGFVEDGAMNVFHLWWMRKAVLGGLWPYFNPYLYHPVGAEMYWHTLAPIKAVWGVALLTIFDPITASNFLLFMTFIAIGFTTWLFLRYMVFRVYGESALGEAAAFAGALVYQLSPYFTITIFNQINLVSVEALPLFLLFYFKFKDTGLKRNLVFAGLAVTYLSFCEYYYLVYIGVFMLCDIGYIVFEKTGTFLSWDLWRDGEIRRILTVIIASLIGALPVLLLLLSHAFPAPLNIIHNDSDFPLDPSGLFLPHGLSFWGPFFKSVIPGWIPEWPKSSFFIGWTIPLFAWYAVRKGLGQSRRFIFIGLVFLVLSLGSFLVIHGNSDLPLWQISIFLGVLCLPFLKKHRWSRDLLLLFAIATVVDLTIGFTLFGVPARVKLPLPYLFFQNIVPFFRRGGMPERFQMMFYLSLAVCFAMAAAELGKNPPWKFCGSEILLILIILPILEFHRFPVDYLKFPSLPESVVTMIKSEPPDTAVFTDYNFLSEFEIIQHEHPISFARLSREPAYAVEEHKKPVYRLFWWQDWHEYKVFSPKIIEEMKSYLKDNHFKYMITHKNEEPRDKFIREQLGGRILYRETFIITHRLPYLVTVYRLPY